MEALAQGYGSDSSSCSSRDEGQQIQSGEHDDSHRSSPSHMGLFANYDSDGSSRNSERKDISHHTRKTEIHLPHNHGMQTTIDKEKRQPMHFLPPPVLSSREPNSSPLLFSKNYLVGKLHYNTINNNPSLVEKLDQLYQNENAGGKSFAEHLKCQKEFGNPHLFPSIIEHFGIDEMESNIGNMDDCSVLLDEASRQGENGQSRDKPRLKLNIENFEYMDRLLVKEEENRIRESQCS
jgi:hypothetical protein